jgi:hypothetical protein
LTALVALTVIPPEGKAFGARPFGPIEHLDAVVGLRVRVVQIDLPHMQLIVR